LLPYRGREGSTEVFSLEYLTDFDLGLSRHGIRASLDPIDGFFLRSHLEYPEAGNQFFGFRKRAVDDCSLVPGEPDTRALRTGLQPFTGYQDTGLR